MTLPDDSQRGWSAAFFCARFAVACSHLSQQAVQRFVIQTGQRAEGVRAFTDSLSNSGGHLVGQQQQFFFVGSENVRQFVDELCAGKIAEVQVFVLDFRDVRVADADLPRQVSLRQLVLRPKLSNPFAKLHCRFTC